MRLYRVVSEGEAQDIKLTGRFRSSDESINGKWFAMSIPDAMGWRHKLQFHGSVFLVEIELADELFAKLFYNPYLDLVGPATFAELEQLTIVTFISITNVT